MKALKIKVYCLAWLLFILLHTKLASPTPLKYIPKLGVLRGINVFQNPSENLTSSEPKSDLKTFYYDQTLDHLNYNPESYLTFPQRYVLNFKHWGGGGGAAAAPILAYLGEESSLDDDLRGIGWLSDNAHRFKALQVYIEHRFYGKSVPFVSSEDALKNATLRGYFNSAQALADYAEILLHIKKKLSAKTSPIIVVGGSYGGMLAAWFRLKYPHIALGAVASSAPVLYFDKITPSDAYYSRVTKDFREASESCYATIKRSWAAIDKAGAKRNGLAFLSKKFKTCKPLKSVSELKDYLENMYTVAAQYDRPPNYPVNQVCNGIDGASQGTDTLARIFSGIVASRGKKSCYNIGEFFSDETLNGWGWQTCSEIVMPIGIGKNKTMFPADPFNLKEYMDSCENSYGVVPRPHWITTYYGGLDIRVVLKSFGSNIIFSNGLRDPYSTAGVLEDISDSIIAVPTKNGSHCLDILPAKKDDPDWLIMQRQIEVNIVHAWILKYYADLLQISEHNEIKF
ncbi:hypothetical protein AB3S75_034541 [Citrus x aurantiifolia]